MSEEVERVQPAPAYEGRPAWYAEFKSRAGKWHRVLNPQGNSIVYTSEQSAINAAKFTGAAWRLEEARKATAEQPREEIPGKVEDNA